MECTWLSWLLVIFILCQIIMIPTPAAITVGGGVGINRGNAGGGGSGSSSVWVGGGINNNNNNPTPTSYPSVSKLTSAYTTLQAWKSAITDDPSCILKTWNGTDVCSYKGIFCSSSNEPFVVAIDLNHANLQGTLVKEVSLLIDISIIHLNSNRFSDTIPDNNNIFEGEILASLGNSPSYVINLANNKFNGNIPASFGFMGSRLKEILLLNNQLTGCIPQGVGVFSEMQVFDVRHTSLMGPLPDTIYCLSDIEVHNLARNKISGVLPNVVCSLRNLMNLTVAYNFFSVFGQDCSRSFFSYMGIDFSLN